MKLVEIAFSTGARRRPEGWLGRLVAVYAAGTALWVVYAATYALIDALALTIIFLTLMLVLVFLTVGATPGADRRRPPVHDLLLAGVSGLTGIYFMVNADEIASRMTLLDPLSTFDVVFASILLILTLETTAGLYRSPLHSSPATAAARCSTRVATWWESSSAGWTR